MSHNAADDDARLIEQVRAVAAAAIAPELAEARVGRAALINTATGFPLAALRKVDLRPDPVHTDEPPALAGVRAVVYWGRPVPGDDPYVVGIVVPAEGPPRVFFATVGHP